MNDNDLLEVVRDRFSQVRLTVPEAAVTGRGRALRRQRRLLPGLAGVAAAGTALGVGLASLGGTVAPTARVSHPANRHPVVTAHRPATKVVQSTYTASFTIQVLGHGRVGLTDFAWSASDYRRALAKAGIPAVVVAGRLSSCLVPEHLFRRIIRAVPSPDFKGHTPPPGWKPGRWEGYAFIVNLGVIPPGVRLGIFYGPRQSSRHRDSLLGTPGWTYVTAQPVEMVLLNSRGGCLAGLDERKPDGQLGIVRLDFRPDTPGGQ